MKRFISAILFSLAVLVCLIFSAPLQANADNTTIGGYGYGYALPTPQYYTIVALPDTQSYTQLHPSLFMMQTQWIAENKDKENIVLVAHEGDIVEAADNLTEWAVAVEAMSVLSDSDIPYITTIGNHDIYPCPDLYYENFGCPESYLLFDIGSNKCIIIAINGIAVDDNYTEVEASVAWANDILQEHPDRKAIILVHGYIWSGGARHTEGWIANAYIWGNLIKPSQNIILVLCGHQAGEGWSSDITDQGTIVNNLLANYQELENGGNGWLRLYRFDADMTKIEVKTYSPYLDQYQMTSKSDFVVDLLEDKAPSKVEYYPPIPPQYNYSDVGRAMVGGGSGGGIVASRIEAIEKTEDQKAAELAWVHLREGVSEWANRIYEIFRELLT